MSITRAATSMDLASGPEPAGRGSVSIPAKVVSRIAEQAAFEVPGVGSDAGGVLGLGAHRDFETRPAAEADVHGSTAVLRLDVGLVFPAALHAVLARLREHVAARVEELTGLTVGRLDITISWLHAAARGRRELL